MLPGRYYDVIKYKLENWVSTGVINKKTIREALGAKDGRDIYDWQLVSALDMIFSEGGYAKNKEGNIIPPHWNLPPGYKKKKRYGRPSQRLFFELFLWSIITLLLTGVVALSLRKEIGIAIGLISALVGYKRNQAWQSFRYVQMK